MNDKQQLADMGAHLAEQQQPLCMAKRIEELEAQVRVMAESLREAISVLSSINHGGESEIHIDGDGSAFWQRGEWVDWAKSEVLPKLKAALAGKLPEPIMQEGWQLVPAKPTPAMRDAMRNCSRKDWPSDELCNVRYAAMLAAAPKPEAK